MVHHRQVSQGRSKSHWLIGSFAKAEKPRLQLQLRLAQLSLLELQRKLDLPRPFQVHWQLWQRHLDHLSYKDPWQVALRV